MKTAISHPGVSWQGAMRDLGLSSGMENLPSRGLKGIIGMENLPSVIAWRHEFVEYLALVWDIPHPVVR